MKKIIRSLVPDFILSFYHKLLALLAAWFFQNPSEKLIIIGVTGTNGKSTVVNLIGQILQAAGKKVSWTSTVNFHINEREWLNNKKMTMLGRLQLQKFLKEAVKQKCEYAVVETSSEGIKQYRHLGLNYDYAIFTNLTPEHLESHGGFANYKKAKGQLFQHLTKKRHKKLNGRTINKTIIVNRDDEYADYFLDFTADKKITFAIETKADFQAKQIELKSNGTIFAVNDSMYKTHLLGKVNVYNCLTALSVCRLENIDEEKIKHALFSYPGVPGRFEFIKAGQKYKIMVDYAPEPESMRRLYETLTIFNFKKIIHVLGSCGGGRDVARRPIMGQLAGENASYVIVTNEDPYNDDPQKIINDVSAGAEAKGKILNQNLFKILDRKEAIKKALSLAGEETDLVLITGKGSEQFICVANGQKIPWDDRKVVRELLKT